MKLKNRLRPYISTTLILFTFANFRIIPGEVVPYYALARRCALPALSLLGFSLSVLLAKLLYVSIINPAEFGIFFVNGIEVLLVIFILGFRRGTQSEERAMLKKLSIIGILTFLTFTGFPELENVKFYLMDRDVYTAELREFNRGFAFLTPEPSYAGVFYLGLLILAVQVGLPRVWLTFLLLCMLLTASIWSFGLFAVYILSQIRPTRWGLVLAILITVGLAFPGVLVPFLAPFGERLAEVAEYVNREGVLQSLLTLESVYGSSRIWPTLQLFGEYRPFGDTTYDPTYSLFAQNFSLFGTICGSLINGGIVFLVMRNIGVSGVRLLWIPLIVGPVVLPTNYLAMRPMRPMRSDPLPHSPE